MFMLKYTYYVGCRSVYKRRVIGRSKVDLGNKLGKES